MFKRVFLIVLDSVGVGHAKDAERFGDLGANTVGHINEFKTLNCPTLRRLGLEKIADINKTEVKVQGLYSRMSEISNGKDTTSGHWEMMGHPIAEPFPTFPNAFPEDLMETLERETGYKYLGNEIASGTEIIARLGEEHIKTNRPIVYTSADSVLQIAAHEDHFGLEELYRICEIARTKVCIGKYEVGRIIARPFIGEAGKFVRTSNRHDYSRMPSKKMYQEILQENNIKTIGVGKIGDIYAHVGFDESYPTKSNAHGMMKVANLIDNEFKEGFLMANLVEFDSHFGHRRNVEGYHNALEEFDTMLGGLLPLLNDDDLLLITADHGNDPTWNGTDHTREMVPLLGYSPRIKTEIHIADRETFADLGQSILDNFNCKQGDCGRSFMSEIKE